MEKEIAIGSVYVAYDKLLDEFTGKMLEEEECTAEFLAPFKKVETILKLYPGPVPNLNDHTVFSADQLAANVRLQLRASICESAIIVPLKTACGEYVKVEIYADETKWFSPAEA